MRPLALFSGSFSAGIFLAQYLLPSRWLPVCTVAAFVLACGRLLLRNDRGRRLLLIGTGLSLALGWNWLFARQVQAPMEALAGTGRTVTMTLCDYAVPTDFGAKATVEIDGLPGRIAYYGEESLLALRPGQTVTDEVSFQSASRIRDEDITNFTSRGVFLLAYQRGEPVYGPGDTDALRWLPARMGRAMRARIAELCGGDAAAFLTAILTGDKSGLSEQASADLSEAGLYHIMAVSGMHCGFLLTMVATLAGRHRRRLVAGIAIPLLVFYAALTGGSPSVVRACIMLTFLLAAPLFHRDSDGPTALAAALFLILLKNPFAAASISLQLSFGAMAGILWLTPKLYKLLSGGKQRGKVFRFIASGFSSTMGALVFTMPLSAYYFGTLVLLSPLSNLLCLWAASIVFMLGLAAVLLGFLFTPLGVALMVLPRLLAGYILTVSHWLAKIPCHALYFVNPYLKYALAFAYLLFAVAYLAKPKMGRKYAVAALLSALALAAAVRLGAARYDGDLEITMLDVGQGQSVLLSSGNGYALVDCGSANSWYDAGGIAAGHLLTMGCRQLDYLILTHYDTDHVNGVEALLARLKVNTLLVPGTAEDLKTQLHILGLADRYGVQVRSLRGEPERIALGGGSLTIHPPVGDGDDNQRSLSILASLGDTDLLITGDMDSAAEKKLLAAHDLPDIEYLAVGHHGSKSSTSYDLLEALTPETALISVGGNSYGHPAEDTLRRLAEQGCTVYRTDLHGSIRLSLHLGE